MLHQCSMHPRCQCFTAVLEEIAADRSMSTGLQISNHSFGREDRPRQTVRRVGGVYKLRLELSIELVKIAKPLWEHGGNDESGATRVGA